MNMKKKCGHESQQYLKLRRILLVEITTNYYSALKSTMKMATERFAKILTNIKHLTWSSPDVLMFLMEVIQFEVDVGSPVDVQ
jgi:hypothetical protein